MRLCRALLIAACVIPLAAGMASAQQRDPFGAPPPQQGGPDPFGAPPPRQPGSDPFGGAPSGLGGMGGFAPPPQQQQIPPCVAEFGKLRDEAQKKAQAIQRAGQQKVPPKEACHLFNIFEAAEEKMLKYVLTNKTSCGVPDEVIKQIRSDHARTTDIRTKICKVAEAPPRPAGPSLSDTLTAPVPDAKNIRSGGTFDTLTGNPLGK
jgi:hypothetical protein